MLNQGLLKESERRKAELSGLTEISAGLQTLVEGSDAQLEDKLCGLNEAWERVHTLTEDWLSTVLVSANTAYRKTNKRPYWSQDVIFWFLNEVKPSSCLNFISFLCIICKCIKATLE